jgi:BirA family biotin operon repressor/biotin-[acetyl-CoA-carboxylase] ligase
MPASNGVRYDGADAAALERLTGAPHVELLGSVTSVLDVAHELAGVGAPDGLLVLADEQTAGRGRQGRVWHSAAGTGVWVAALVRPAVAPEGGAFAIRAGLAMVAAVSEAAPEASPRLKWPNDLMVHGRKAGGVLCEARWMGARLGWIAVGVGVNVRGPVAAEVRGSAIALDDVAHAATRIGVLSALAPRLRALATGAATLGAAERAAFQRVQWQPRRGAEGAPSSVARGAGGDGAETGEGGEGVDAEGALLVRAADGSLDRRVVPI